MTSDFLYASPSFLEGIARIMDFANALNEYNSSLTPQEADAAAIRMDWEMVGQDFRSAVAEFETEHQEQLTFTK